MKKIQCIWFAAAFTFLLGIKNGRIALWAGGGPEPVKVYPYRAEMLPKPDQKALEKGIVLQDLESLNKILEDYLS